MQTVGQGNGARVACASHGRLRGACYSVVTGAALSTGRLLRPWAPVDGNGRDPPPPHFPHCAGSAELGSNFHFNAGDDAAAVRWLDVDPREKDYNNLYASHKEWVDKVAAGLRDQGVGRDSDHGMPSSQ